MNQVGLTNNTFNEYVLDQVVENITLHSDRMVVREYKKIGEGAFGTVVEAVLRKDYKTDSEQDREEPWLGPFAIKRVPAKTQSKSRELEN